MRTIAQLFILFFNPFWLIAQDTKPDTVIFHPNSIRTCIASNGRLFWTGNGGLFELPEYSYETSFMQLGGLWLAGFSGPSGYAGAHQLYDEGEKSDFIPGILTDLSEDNELVPIEGFNRIWRVNRADIEAHIKDYQEDSKITNPIPSIYRWPGRGNPHSPEYNGLAIPEYRYEMAPFWDENFDGIYNPDDGDFPAIEGRSGFLLPFPDEMLWFSFHDYHSNRLTNTPPLAVEVHCLVFGYNCSEGEALDNTIFVNYTLINKSPARLDSLYAGLFLDFSVGCPEDDYLGTIAETGTVYAYNADSFDGPCPGATAYGYEPPVVSCTMFEELIVTDAAREEPIDTLFLRPFTHIMPLPGPGETAPPAQAFPVSPLGFYRYLTGRWRDGTPLYFGGNGFQSSNLEVPYIFPGLPTEPWTWTEKSAQRPPGYRRAIASSGHFRLSPRGVNRFTVGFTLHPCFGCFPEGDSEGFGKVHYDINQIKYFLDSYTETPFPCRRPIPPIEPLPSLPPEIRVGPNPVREQACIFALHAPAYWYRIFNLHGQLIYEANQPVGTHVFSVSNWQHGVYILQAAIGGEVLTTKFVVD